MNAFFYALMMSLALAATNVNAIGVMMGCGNYTISPKGLTCDDRTDIICTGGTKTFVFCDQCILSKFPEKPATNDEACTIAYRPSSPTTRTCVTDQGSFTCTGYCRGQANANGCVPINQIPRAS